MAAAVFVLSSAHAARADDFGKRFTIDVAPVYDLGTTGDADRAPFPGFTTVIGPGPKPNANDLLLDYGADFRITNQLHLNFSHDNLDFMLGPIITVPNTVELYSGAISDYTNTISLQATPPVQGLALHANYFNHVRTYVSGLCLNQDFCPNAAGQQTGNPSGIEEHGYVFGGTYTFGPNSPIGKIFTVGADLKYVPRPSTPPGGETPNLGGLGAWVGSQTMFPYSISAKIPISTSHTFIPFVGYDRGSVLFAAEATPEVYNITNFGFAKVINRNVVLSIVDLNFAESRASDTVPPPDNVRFSVVNVKLDFKTGL